VSAGQPEVARQAYRDFGKEVVIAGLSRDCAYALAFRSGRVKGDFAHTGIPAAWDSRE
jgi:uncharacterized protein with PIN domain